MKCQPSQPSTRLTPYRVSTVLPTVFPVLHFTSLWLLCNCQLVLFNPFPFLIHPPNFPLIWQLSVCSLDLLVCFCFVCLFCFWDSTYKWNHMVFVLFCLTYFTQHNTLQVHPCYHKWQTFILFYDQAIFHCIYVPHLYSFTYQWTLRLLPYLGYCK